MYNTYLLTSWSRVLLEKLTGSQLVKKFPAFYGNRRFITAFTRACHLSLSWARSIQSMSPHPTSWTSILILYHHLRLGLASGSFPQVSPPKHHTMYNSKQNIRAIQPFEKKNGGARCLFCLNITELPRKVIHNIAAHRPRNTWGVEISAGCDDEAAAQAASRAERASHFEHGKSTGRGGRGKAVTEKNLTLSVMTMCLVTKQSLCSTIGSAVAQATSHQLFTMLSWLQSHSNVRFRVENAAIRHTSGFPCPQHPPVLPNHSFTTDAIPG